VITGAVKRNGAADAQIRSDGLDRGALGAVADDVEANVRMVGQDRGHRADQHIGALDRDESADVQQAHALIGRRERRSHLQAPKG